LCRIDLGSRIKRLSNTFLGRAAGSERFGFWKECGEPVSILELDLGLASIEEWLIDRTFIVHELSINVILMVDQADSRKIR
jgi:hypothetical protein